MISFYVLEKHNSQTASSDYPKTKILKYPIVADGMSEQVKMQTSILHGAILFSAATIGYFRIFVC